ncbi:MAG: (d)CMP kinase [Saprospiraceae bacterium]|nr:(d)CMP kinase [Saprospiraceae bacterium]MDP4853375.1 (d)CMP kinase [Saprospiraceae bacterium]MDP4913101.1 (d)CMP kinase [Saprospiraceae bacterium]MDP5047918.1 (d)CMP kinase [Saprospiraceae bacterium]
MGISIAIDGFSSCGKSTLAKAMAESLQFLFVDSGAMYRAVTYYFLKNEVPIHQPKVVLNALENIHITLEPSPNGNITLLNGKDISTDIRDMAVAEMVSKVAAISSVRTAMVKQQRQMSLHNNLIMDGRDIGTVVFPNAVLKIFLTADIEVRVNRRYLDLLSKDTLVSLTEIRRNLFLRDYIDSTRTDSPLLRAEDAIVLNNSNLSREEQLEICLLLAKKRMK